MISVSELDPVDEAPSPEFQGSSDIGKYTLSRPGRVLDELLPATPLFFLVFLPLCESGSDAAAALPRNLRGRLRCRLRHGYFLPQPPAFATVFRLPFSIVGVNSGSTVLDIVPIRVVEMLPIFLRINITRMMIPPRCMLPATEART
jgi:hypothetical protein